MSKEAWSVRNQVRCDAKERLELCNAVSQFGRIVFGIGAILSAVYFSLAGGWNGGWAEEKQIVVESWAFPAFNAMQIGGLIWAIGLILSDGYGALARTSKRRPTA